jgi:hypothetical protein
MASYIPVLTTVISIFFLGRIVPHYLSKRSPYLLWWTLGVLTFGLGTLTESINAIYGWSEWNTRVWYIVGALLGGYPLAQGTIYLLMKRRFSDSSAGVCSIVIRWLHLCIAIANRDPGWLRSPPQRESVRLAVGPGILLIAQPLWLRVSFWRRHLLGCQVFRNRQGKNTFPRQRSYCYRGTPSRHWRQLHPLRLCRGAIRYGTHWPELYLFRLSHN